ncbi:uncharacterized protein LOC141691872 [Apium graveolens]|uniref:uncharacterized protein LOC141691872 n=1 Tax=Apium graveolens TaxID=4045 RepID=UPI003D78E6A7
MGSFPWARGDLRYVLVAIDYMIKIPVVLVFNNGPQFVGSDFEAYLKELGIKHKRSSVAHPQGNEQVEVPNRTILQELEKRLEESKKSRPYELSKVLWLYEPLPG